MPFAPQTEANNEVVTHYLVKWRSLPYEDATWELEEDVDAESIRKFNHLQLLPPEDQLEVSGRGLINFHLSWEAGVGSTILIRTFEWSQGWPD